MSVRAVRWAVIQILVPAALLSQGSTPVLDFSGLLFGNFQYRTDSAARAATAGQPGDRFDIGRAYLNFRLPAGDRGAVRVTTDVYQQTGTAAAYYAGWAIRLKYGYFQYELTRNLAGVQGLAAAARIGMLQTVIVEHEETFWPRWMGNSPTEFNGFFSSADVGLSALITLPNRYGEVYTTMVNGPGYSSGENDRYKDFAGRVSITPFGRDSGFLRTLTVTPWYSVGALASQFVLGGPGQVGPVSQGLEKNRRGVFLGIRDRRLTGGLELAQRLETVESVLNTPVSPRVTSDVTRGLVSGFAFVRPLEIFDPKRRSPLSVFGRHDRLDNANVVGARNVLTWFGALWDVNARVTFSIDYQELKADNPPVVPPTNTTVPTRSVFLHWVVNY